MKNLFKFTLSILLIFVFLTASATYAEPYVGYVTAESKQVEPGEHFSIDLRLYNNTVDIGSIFIPMHYSSSNLVFDSISFVGTILSENFNGVVSSQAGNILWVSYLPIISGTSIIPIVASEGLIATLYFTAINSAVPGNITIDSINEVFEVSPGVFSQTNVQISSESGVDTYYPSFSKGIISIAVPTAVEEDLNGVLPGQFALTQNYPNPFNPTTNIGFALPTAGHVKLEIFNVLGQLVKTLVDNNLEAGYHDFEYDASDQASGIFFYRLIHKDGVETKKMVLLK